MKKRRLRIVTIVLGLLFILFCPYRSMTAPAWRVQIVDESGKPIPGIQVREGWAYFGLDLAPEIDDRVTDSDGHIAFPRRVTWASVATRATLGDPTDGVHAGPSLYIQACDSDHLKEAKLFWDGNKFWNPATHEGESQLVAKSVKECGEISMGLLELPLYTRASR